MALTCQECGGIGEYAEDWIDGHALMYPCGWCKRTGIITPKMRGLWLSEQQYLKKVRS